GGTPPRHPRSGPARRESIITAVAELQQGAQDVLDRGGEDVAPQLVARREVLRGEVQRLPGPDAAHQQGRHLLQFEGGVVESRQREFDYQFVPRHHGQFAELDICSRSDISSRAWPTTGHIVFISYSIGDRTVPSSTRRGKTMDLRRSRAGSSTRRRSPRR